MKKTIIAVSFIGTKSKTDCNNSLIGNKSYNSFL